ncbi:MAG TPA: ATP-binding protein, partial [Aquabacterium sp.]|nr:ATP-binding protein [Aquabacterium sp.]
AGRALLSVVNDVLDLSKIEASELTLEQAPFAVGNLLQDVEEMFRLAAGSRPITFAVVTESELPPLLLGDVTRIRQVLINLLGNAFKFTERGQVSLNVRETRRSGDELGLRFTVRDTGLGMSTVVLARLFTPFMQADASTTRRFGGTGLGLSIVHRLVNLMGGHVSVESQEGQGSTFHVDLPLRIAPTLPEREGEAAQSLTLHVLGLQGEPRQILSEVAVTLGWRVRVVDGPEGVPGVAELPGGAVLLSTRAALATLTAPMAIPLLLWDAGALGADPQDDPVRAGVDAVLIGVPTGPSLFNAVNDALMHRGESTACLLHSTRLEAAGSQWLSGVRVLVVDDSDINLEVAQSILQREGAQVVLARHGRRPCRCCAPRGRAWMRC